MKRLALPLNKTISSRFFSRSAVRITANLTGMAAVAMLASCGGSSTPERIPEPKTIELFMQSGGAFINEAGGSCAVNEPTFALSQRSFEQDVLRKDLNLRVISSECRYLSQAKPAEPQNYQCAAEYRYVIAAEGAIQTRNDIVIPENDSYFYSPDEYFGFLMFPWGARNNTTQGPPSVFEVKFPPKFTAGYVSCGG